MSRILLMGRDAVPQAELEAAQGVDLGEIGLDVDEGLRACRQRSEITDGVSDAG